jgi:head-tail adaptor
MIRAGKLDRLIIVQRLTEAVDDAGTVSRTWQTIGTLRAEVLTASLAEAGATFGETETASQLLRTRYVDGITTGDRVVLDGVAHDVKAIGVIGRRVGLELRIERVR